VISSLIAGSAAVLAIAATRYATALAASQWRVRVTYPRRMRRLQVSR
jgi:hypothetical protein